MGRHRETQRVADYIGGVSKNTGLYRHVKGCQGQRLARNAVNNMVFKQKHCGIIQFEHAICMQTIVGALLVGSSLGQKRCI